MSNRSYNELDRDLKQVDYSCDFFDSAIEQIEEARKINTRLRSIASDAIDALEYRESEYADLEDKVKELESKLEEYMDEIDELEKKLEDSSMELREARSGLY
jgi:chromosome segregation ATPase